MTDWQPKSNETEVEYRQRQKAAAEANLRYAETTHELAVSLEQFVFPPWRWPRWFALRREVQRRRRTWLQRSKEIDRMAATRFAP